MNLLRRVTGRTIPALTVCQPWAWAIMHAGKTVENRSWASNYRGPLLIHAGSSRRWLKQGLPAIRDITGRTPQLADLQFGHLLGLVELFDCTHYRAVKTNPWAEGPLCLLLRQPELLPAPIPYRGQLGLFQVPVDLIKRKLSK